MSDSKLRYLLFDLPNIKKVAQNIWLGLKTFE